MRRDERIGHFVNIIWYWYSRHKRELPWRDLSIPDDTERAYQILVSEVMLQQTQVDRVKVIFVAFLKRFPRLRDLALASNREVILAWRGMGYNSRALRLRDAARHIRERFLVSSCWLLDRKHKTSNQKPFDSAQGKPATSNFPTSMEKLLQIPGVGHYTAAAILNFAFNIPTPCIDTNIRRILHRTFFGPENSDGSWRKDDTYLLKLAGEVLEVAVGTPPIPQPLSPVAGERGGTSPLPPLSRGGRGLGGGGRDARNWHAALMDFGSLVQTKKSPKWDGCPLTARGLMKTTEKDFQQRFVGQERSCPTNVTHEPGRIIAGRFTPNRIIRGRIVEALRDAQGGIPLDAIGRTVCGDWSPAHHQKWLKGIVEKLKRDRLVDCKGKKYILAD